MKKLNKPTFNVEDVFTTCVNDIVRDVALKSRLLACEKLIIEAAKEFDRKVLPAQLHTITRESVVNRNVTAKELEGIYKSRMLKKSSLGRAIYDKLISAPANDICPLCSQREVKTLDHHLPKANYPRLSVTPINLVPSCSDCNKSKLTSYPNTAEEETLHPYYDDIDNEIWLVAEVIKTTPPSIKFSVHTSDNWTELLGKRVKYHFDVLLLNKLYGAQAAVELGNLNFQLCALHEKSGAIAVKKYLLGEAKSRLHANRNSWQTAMFNAISQDEWFCDGGFKLS